MSKARALYRRILRVARTWEGTEKERVYIKTEARQGFEANRKLTDPMEIEKAITEAEQRLEVGIHYKIPYPRPVYVDPGTVGGDNDFKRKSSRDKVKAGRLAQKARVNTYKWN